MHTVKLSSLLRDTSLKEKAIGAIRRGEIFVYPTDTVYGIGCNAQNGESVGKIRLAKGSGGGKSYSVIAPSKEWIRENARLSPVSRDLVEKILPGPYTIILNASKKAPKAVVSPEKSIGVRIPAHPFTGILEEAGVPFVSTSLNVSGEEPVTTIKDTPPKIAGIAGWAVDAGAITGHASRVFDLRSGEIRILRY